MEFISYNGVELKVVATNAITVIPRNNDEGTAYLWTDWDIDVICQVHPYATSYSPSLGAVRGVPPFFNPGQPPGMTINAIKLALETPRGILTCRAGGAIILDSPTLVLAANGSPRNPCDCTNGPFCKVYAIRQIIGMKHFIVHCRFKTSVNNNFNVSVDSSLNPLPDPTVSNTWKIIEEIDDLLYPIRTVVGQAVLRADLMRNYGITADSLRASFFFPVPTNYQRESVRVELSPDGTMLNYMIRDEGKCYNLGKDSPVRRFEGFLNGACKYTPAFMRSLLSPNGITFPRYYLHCRVDLWGSRDTLHKDLYTLAFSLAAGQLSLTGRSFAGTEEIIFRCALHEKYFSCEITREWGLDLTPSGVAEGFSGTGFVAILDTFRRRDFESLSMSDNVPGIFPPDAQIVPQVPSNPPRMFASQNPNFPIKSGSNPPFQGLPANEGSQGALGLNQDTNELTKFITQLLLNPQQVPHTPVSRYDPATAFTES